jgi:nucleotide-binding universal stress UspA family protein
MEAWRRILCPTDFSACSLAAVREAARLLVGGEGELLLLHAVEVPRMAWMSDAVGDPAELARTLEQAARRRLEVWQRWAGAHGAVRVGVRLEELPAVQAILEVAQRWPADLIVMGTHGRSGLRRLLGSVADRVVSMAPCPVLTLHGEAHEGEAGVLRG